MVAVTPVARVTGVVPMATVVPVAPGRAGSVVVPADGVPAVPRVVVVVVAFRLVLHEVQRIPPVGIEPGGRGDPASRRVGRCV